jgi:GT2 family glycosyltransferase
MISFVVIAYNEAQNIAGTLDAITGLDELGDCEIVVVDDGSRDGTADIVRVIAAADPRVRLIDLEHNRGRGYARWRGIDAARGTLIATVDADIILPSGWLVRARAALQGHDAIGGVAVPDGDAAYVCRRFRLRPRPVSPTNAVTGNNALYRRRVFDVAGFDPSLREGEDSAFNHAMSKARLSIVTVPDLIVRHEEKKSFPTSVRFLFDVGRGATRQVFTLRQLRMPDLVAAAFVAAVAAGIFTALAGWPLIGLAVVAGFVLAAGTGHVLTRFHAPWSHGVRLLLAAVVDSVLLLAYLVGRVAGLSYLWHRPQGPQPALASYSAAAYPPAAPVEDQSRSV